MKPVFPAALMGAVCFLPVASFAQVPHVISYQGQVNVSSHPFTGQGLFKFALIAPDGPAYWSNDGTSTNGSQPLDPVELPVSQGMFSVLLGDADLPHMSPIPYEVFSHGDVRLRVWFSEGRPHSFEQLLPDQRISAVGYAMVAGTVPDGSITAAQLSDGAITAAKLAPGAAAASLFSSGQSGVPSGGIVFSLEANSSSLGDAGYEGIGSINIKTENWRRLSDGVGRRYAHTAVWTGTEMLVWGGGAGSFLNTGGRYNPTANVWTATTTSNAPAGRWFHKAVWTGSEMLIWGGRSSFAGPVANRADGGRYDPQLDRWSPISTVGAPAARSEFVAIWTGSEMLVWGGYGNGGASPAEGGRYDPATDTWSAITTNGAPVSGGNPLAVWTGTEMIVWGGGLHNGTTLVASLRGGGRYNPATDTWSPLATNDAPAATAEGSAVWTGSEMITWSGLDYALPNWSSVDTGGRYSPATDTWQPLSGVNRPTSRSNHGAIWTGSEMIVWGGHHRTGSGITFLGSGARYNPTTDVWTPVVPENAPSARAYPSAVWTGEEMILYAGYNNQDGSQELNTTHSWSPQRQLYLYLRP